MAKLRVLAENPPPARGYVEDQLRELRDYITRMKDELEFLLTHLGEDNLDSILTGYVGQIRTQTGEIDGINGEIEDINTALAGKQDTLTFDSAPTSGSDNPVTSGGVYTALASKPTVYRDFYVAAGKTLEITTTYNQGNYALLVCSLGPRTTTNGAFYVSGYSKNASYHHNKTLAEASDITVVNSNEKIVITNGNAGSAVYILVLELFVSPASMLTYAVTT